MNEDETGIEDGEIDFDGALNLDRLSELEKELEEVRQHVLYAQAETQNVRRRLNWLRRASRPGLRITLAAPS